MDAFKQYFRHNSSCYYLAFTIRDKDMANAVQNWSAKNRQVLIEMHLKPSAIIHGKTDNDD